MDAADLAEQVLMAADCALRGQQSAQPGRGLGTIVGRGGVGGGGRRRVGLQVEDAPVDLPLRRQPADHVDGVVEGGVVQDPAVDEAGGGGGGAVVRVVAEKGLSQLVRVEAAGTAQGLRFEPRLEGRYRDRREGAWEARRAPGRERKRAIKGWVELPLFPRRIMGETHHGAIRAVVCRRPMVGGESPRPSLQICHGDGEVNSRARRDQGAKVVHARALVARAAHRVERVVEPTRHLVTA